MQVRRKLVELVELVASGEPAAGHVETCGRPNGGVRRPSPND